MKNTLVSTALLFAVICCSGQQIQRAEYFIDSDPGFGLATPVPVPVPADNLFLSFNVNTGNLAEGFHMLVIRARDNLGRWSHSSHQVFYLLEAAGMSDSPIDRAEYFVDSDPGFGLAAQVQVPDPGNDLSLSFEVNTAELSEGFHMMVIRVRDQMGRWSHPRQQIFYLLKRVLPVASEITLVEYFVDEDPGFGMGTPVEVALPGQDVEVDFLVNLGGLADGDHLLYIRSKDASNHWGHTMIHAFTLNATGAEEQEVVPWFRIYPNPNAGNFILEFTDLKAPAELRITDLNGRVVHLERIDNRYVSVTADLAPGVYMVTVDSGNQYFKKKLIIGR